MSDKEFILAKSDLGAGKSGAADGPQAIIDELANIGVEIHHYQIVETVLKTNQIDNNYGNYLSQILKNMLALNNCVENVSKTNKVPVILSGDHSNAIGGLSGVKNAHPNKRIGVIWIDAHADLHSPYTTPSGNIHGMPLAVLSGTDNTEDKKNIVNEETNYYWQELKKLGVFNIEPKFDLKDLVLIGIRDAEDEEWNLIEKRKIKCFEPEEIDNKGIDFTINETLNYLKDCDLIYVSFDADSLDPSISVGTGTTADNGLKIEEAQTLFKTLFSHPKTAAFEITEVNPNLDENGKKMAQVIAELLSEFL